MEKLQSIAGLFQFSGDFLEAEVCHSGHINDTYVVTYRQSDGSRLRYILQRINSNVFKKPAEVMANIQAVTAHLRKKIAAAGGDPERETLNLILAKAGGSFVEADGEFWRAYKFIEGAKTYQTVQDPAHFYHAGKAFGRFQLLLQDFPAETLYETIPNFHNTPKRLGDLRRAVEADACGRLAEVQREVDFVFARAEDTKVVVDAIAEGAIPLRVTHNDTKFDNILIDDLTGEGICVLDLDTVMPGSYLYDFGDAIRFGASTAAEDEQDRSKVNFDISLFRQFTEGYLSNDMRFMTPAELENLAFSARLITLECGMRFLEDYLNGDKYFRIHRPQHNLDRARTQFKLVADMEAQFDEMRRIVDAAVMEGSRRA